MSTGSLPFRGDTSAVIFEAILNRAPVAPVRLNPEIPSKLEEIIKKALEKDRGLRYHSAADLRTDLKRLKREIESGKSATVTVSATALGEAAATPTSHASTASVAAQDPSTRLPAWWRSRAAIGVASLALIAVLVAGVRHYLSEERGEIDSVAVLPFSNASGDPNTEYLSDGITESLINSLSQVPHLTVKSRDSAFMYKGKDADARTVGRELGVRAVFKGRVMQRGDSLTISAELIDAQNDNHLWGQQYTRKITDVVGLEEGIAKEMTSALRMRLTDDDERRMAKSYTANPDAYRLYLQGRYWCNKRTGEGLSKGIDYFQQAIAKDPTYALPYSGLADCYNLLPIYANVPPKDAFPKAKEAALKALQLDDTLAEAHTSLGYVKSLYDWDWSGGEREFQRAVELNPSYATAHHWRGVALVATGRSEEAIAEQKRALELDPLSLIFNRDLGAVFYVARQYDQAIEQERKTLELDPNFILAHFYLGLAYVEKSMHKEGIAECEKELVVSPGNPYALSALGYAYAVGGRRAEAQKVLGKLNQLSKQTYVPALSRAAIHAGLGEKDKAFEWLEKSYEERSTGLIESDVKVSPVYDPLRSDPRFADLLRRMNLQP